MIISPPILITTSNKDMSSLHLSFNTSTIIEDALSGASTERYFGLAQPDLIFHFRTGALNMFVDCTYKTVPKDFTND